MRKAILALSLLVIAGFASPAQARSQWCAQIYGEGGRESCWFTSLRQCQESVSGRGGFCRPSQYSYDTKRRRIPFDAYGMGSYR